jgi:spermidine synthase
LADARATVAAALNPSAEISICVTSPYSSATADMRRQVEALFGQWQASGAPVPSQQNGKVKADKARVWLVNKADATETWADEPPRRIA